MEYEKRRLGSQSPLSRIASSSRSVTDKRFFPPVSSHSHVKIRSESPGSHYSNPPKKKIRREVTHISPPRGFQKPMISGSHISHKVSSASGPPGFHNRERTFSAIPGRPPSYGLSEHSRDGYDMPRHKSMAMDPVYPPPDQKRSSEYLAERSKRYGLTLDQRFRSVSGDLSHGDHQRVQFTREDLENITIDIKRNLRDFSPTVRRILDPSEVKLVRRPHEGHRPIFDREEIKQAPRDLREDAYVEQKLYAHSSVDRKKSGPFVLNYKEMENYEITRHKFESNRPSLTNSTHTLSDRWRKIDQKSVLDRDERSREYPPRSRTPLSFPESRRMPRPRSLDRDYGLEHRPKPLEYPPPVHKPLPVNPADLRHSLAIRRKDGSIHDARERLMERRLSERSHMPPPMRSEPHHYPDIPKYPSTSHKLKEKSHRMEGPSSRDSPFSRSSDKMRPRPDKLPEYMSRPDRFKYPPWEEKSSAVSKSYSYYEEDRESSDSYYSRGGFRGSRRGFRGRPFRGSSSRGAGFRSRGKTSSYHQMV